MQAYRLVPSLKVLSEKVELDMLRSCQYCGRIHDRQYTCPEKRMKMKARQSYRTEDNKQIYSFHRSQDWKNKSIEIRQRDNYCCQVCIRGLHEPMRKYETDNISVHHIIPIAEEWDRRMDNDILVSLCRRHHEMADTGEISREELLRIAEEQERTAPG